MAECYIYPPVILHQAMNSESRKTPEEKIKSSPLLSREAETIEEMTRMFCRRAHGSEDLCPKCREFLYYALARLGRCPYGENKPVCGRCPIHCYKPAQRSFAKEVMKYSGPRLFLKKPAPAFMHLLHAFKKPPQKHRNPNAAKHTEKKSSKLASAAIFSFVLLVQILFGAHLVFHGHAAAAAAAAASPLLWFAGRRCTAALSAAAFIESAEWMRTLFFFACERSAEGRSMMPGAAVILGCAAATAAAGWIAWRKSRSERIDRPQI